MRAADTAMVASSRARVYVTAIAAGSLVALLSAAGGIANDHLRRERSRAAAQAQLTEAAASLENQLAGLFAVAATLSLTEQGQQSTRFDNAAWTFDGTTLHRSANQSAIHEQLTARLLRAVALTPMSRFLGPFPAADGRDFLLAFTRSGPSGERWSAAGASLEALLERAGIQGLLSHGMDVQITDLTRGRVLLASRTLPADDSVAVHVALMGTRWELRGQPRFGWGDSPLGLWVLVALAGMGAGFWILRLLQRPQRLSRELQAQSRRLQRLNASLAEALRFKEQAENLSVTLARIDAATALPNRAAFCEAVEEQLRLLRIRVTGGLAIIVVQFESTRLIANVYGHSQLEVILREAATRLQALPGLRGALGRVTDVELAVWIQTQQDAAAAERLAKQLCEQLANPFRVAGTDTHVAFGVGFSPRNSGLAYAQEMLQEASAAALDALLKGPDICVAFEPKTRATTIDRLQLESDLRHSLTGQGLCLHYQPIVAADSRRVAGFEALLRWQHPLEGLLLPGRFIPIAQSARLMLEIDRWVLRRSIMQARQWELDLAQEFFISANVSPEHFARRSLVTDIAELLSEFAVPPQRLHLEIVESALLSDLHDAATVASELRELGVHLCLDDFGTGYSSLNYLRTLPVDAIKVDRSFVERMVSNSKDFGVVKTVIDLARYLELTCVVEGVETAEQHELLQVLAPDFCQGYFYSAAVPAERAEQMLRDIAPARRIA